jgi:hypothetical protein
MTHPDKFNQSDVELLKVWDGKTPQPAEKTKSKS